MTLGTEMTLSSSSMIQVSLKEIFSWSTKKKEQEHDCNKIQKLMST